jgi:hypothetical protein
VEVGEKVLVCLSEGNVKSLGHNAFALELLLSISGFAHPILLVIARSLLPLWKQ